MSASLDVQQIFLLLQERELLLSNLKVVEEELRYLWPLRFTELGIEYLEQWVGRFRGPITDRIIQINKTLGLQVALPPLRQL